MFSGQVGPRILSSVPMSVTYGMLLLCEIVTCIMYMYLVKIIDTIRPG